MAAEPLPHEPSPDHGAAPGDADRPLWTSRPRQGGPRRADRQDRVVQSMARKVTRPCRRNGCPAPARASMVLDYAGKCVTLVPLLDEADPRFLEVCPSHAASLDVPRGWELVDERDEVEEPTGPPTAREMGSSATVAVLAEALRHDDDPAGEVDDGPADEGDEPAVSTPGSPVAELPPDDPADPVPAPEAPTAPAGRVSRPPADPATPDERQLRLGDTAPRPRPVPAAPDE